MRTSPSAGGAGEHPVGPRRRRAVLQHRSPRSRTPAGCRRTSREPCWPPRAFFRRFFSFHFFRSHASPRAQTRFFPPRVPCLAGRRRRSAPAGLAARCPVRPRPDHCTSSATKARAPHRTPPWTAPGTPQAVRSHRPRPGWARSAPRRCPGDRRAPERRRRCTDDGEAGVNGPKPPRASGRWENPTIVVVRPWKPPRGHHDPGAPLRHPLHPSVAPLARDLDPDLDRLGTGVHRQHHLPAEQRRGPAQNGPSWSLPKARLVSVTRSSLAVGRGAAGRDGRGRS